MNNFEDILFRVQKPSQYLGGEIHSYTKNPSDVDCRIVLAYPDLYEIGMSYLGLQVLYDSLNREPDIFAERVFAPYLDMRQELYRANLALCSLETRTPLHAFDILGFSLQHELNFPDVLNMLSMGGIPIRSDQRSDRHPIVIAGGPCATNPEPLAPALDAVYLGDAEAGLVEIARMVGRMRHNQVTRKTILDKLMHEPGIYVPSRYKVSYDADGRIDEIIPQDGAPKNIMSRLIANIDQIPPPVNVLVPCSSIIHDRLTVEIQRGCNRGCRFCQAGMINRPVRQRSMVKILDAVSEGLKLSGYEQASFLSLSAGDHPCIIQILEEFFERHARQKISASLPSLRAETLTNKLAQLMKTVRKSGFTIAPEAGTDRLRKVINKQITDEHVLQAASGAFEAGWELIKLYFMIGLPTEREEDRESIVDLVSKIRKLRPKSKRRSSIHVGLNIFVPKAHTPFQWEAMLEVKQSANIQKMLHNELSKMGGVKVGFSKVDMSITEGILARGSRKQFEMLKSWAETGGLLSGWSEHFSMEEVEKTFGNDHRKYLRARSMDETLPWDHLHIGPERDFLWKERDRAYREKFTPVCSQSGCYQCGVCNENDLTPILDSQTDTAPSASVKTDVETETDTASIRLCLTKTGTMAHLSHIEYMNTISRALRRAEWPLIYSQGFHPKPKISFGPACPVGCESFAEWIDVKINPVVEIKILLDRLRSNLPTGIKLLKSRCLSEGSGTIMKEARAVRYRISSVEKTALQLAHSRTAALMQKDEWKVTRKVKNKVKTVDVRPTILNIELKGSDTSIEAVLDIALTETSSARPIEIAKEIFGLEHARIIREEIVFRVVQ